jgi:hypothetical protein
VIRVGATSPRSAGRSSELRKQGFPTNAMVEDPQHVISVHSRIKLTFECITWADEVEPLDVFILVDI